MKILNRDEIDFENLDRFSMNLGIEVLDIAEKLGGVLIELRTQTCCRCDKTINDKSGICRCKDLKLIKHHISYSPEIIVKICEDCHHDIHNSDWGAPTHNDGTIDFDRYESGKDYSSNNRCWVMYVNDERDQFYMERDDLKEDRYKNKKMNFINGININWSALKSGVGIGICMKCNLPSCSNYFGCYIKKHDCKNPKMMQR